MAFENIINTKIPGWENKKINGKTFNKIFQLDGIPLWWFYSRFVTGHVLPKQFSLEKTIEKEKPNIFSQAYYAGVSNAFRKYFLYNEKKKIKTARNKKIEGGKVLFLTYTNHRNKETGKVFRIQGIIDALFAQQKPTPFVVYTDPLSKLGVKGLEDLDLSIYGLVKEEEKEKARELAQKLYDTWRKCDKKELFAELWPGIKHVMNFFFSYEFIYNLALYYYTLKRTLKEEQVKAIVLTSRNGFFEKCCLAAAEKTNVPVIIVQHGVGLGTIDPEVAKGVKFAVFGEVYRERLQQQGVAEKDIVVTGPVIFDEIVKFKRKKDGEKILIITGPFVEEGWIPKGEYFGHIKKVLEATSALTTEVVIKLHPMEKYREEYKQLASAFKNVQIIDKLGAKVLYELLAESGLMINFYSTVALEAMLLDISILTIDLGPKLVPDLEKSPYIGGLHVKISDDVKTAAILALADSPELKQKRKAIVEKYCYKADGKAAERVVKLVVELVNGNE